MILRELFSSSHSFRFSRGKDVGGGGGIPPYGVGTVSMEGRGGEGESVSKEGGKHCIMSLYSECILHLYIDIADIPVAL